MDNIDSYGLRARFAFEAEKETFASMSAVKSQLKGIQTAVKDTAMSVDRSGMGRNLRQMSNQTEVGFTSVATAVKELSATSKSAAKQLAPLKAEFKALKAEARLIDFGDLTDADQFKDATRQVHRYVDALKELESQVGRDTTLEREFSAELKRRQKVAQNQVDLNESQRKVIKAAERTGTASMLRDAGQAIAEPIKAMGADATRILIGFNDQMSQVAAVSSGTAIELQRVRDKAKELGATTRFSASDAAEGFVSLAQAGYDAQQQLEAIEGTLNLASAGALGLGEATEIAVSSMGAFGLAAKDAGRAADILAYGANAGVTNVQEIGEALKYAGPPAKSFGATLEQTTAMISQLSNAGIKASSAGTALRSGFLRLAAPPATAKGAIAELGLEVQDSEGKMRSMVDILRDINVKFKDLSQAKKLEIVKDLFGAEATSSFSYLIENIDKLDKLTAATYKASEGLGAATLQSRIMENNIGGSLRNLESAIEGFQLNFIEPLEPVMRALLDTASGFINFFTELPAPIRTLISLGGGLVFVLASLTAALGTLGFAFFSLQEAAATAELGLISLRSAAIPLTGFFDSAVAAFRVQGPLGVIKELNTQIGEMPGLLGTAATAMRAVGRASLTFLLSPLGILLTSLALMVMLVNKLVPQLGLFQAALDLLKMPFKALGGFVDGFKQGFQDALGEEFMKQFAPVAEEFQKSFNKMYDSMEKLVKAASVAGQILGRVFATIFFPMVAAQVQTAKRVIGLWQGMVGAILGLLKKLVSFLPGVKQQLLSNLAQNSPGPTVVIPKRWEAAVEKILNLWNGLVEGAKTVGRLIKNAFLNPIAFVEYAFAKVMAQFDLIGDRIASIARNGKQVFSGFATRVMSAFQPRKDRVDPVDPEASIISASVGTVPIPTFETMKRDNQVLNDIRAEIDTIKTEASSIGPSVEEGTTGPFVTALKTMLDTFTQVSEQLGQFGQDVYEKWQPVIDPFVTVAKTLGEIIFNMGRALMLNKLVLSLLPKKPAGLDTTAGNYFSQNRIASRVGGEFLNEMLTFPFESGTPELSLAKRITKLFFLAAELADDFLLNKFSKSPAKFFESWLPPTALKAVQAIVSPDLYKNVTGFFENLMTDFRGVIARSLSRIPGVDPTLVNQILANLHVPKDLIPAWNALKKATEWLAPRFDYIRTVLPASFLGIGSLIKGLAKLALIQFPFLETFVPFLALFGSGVGQVLFWVGAFMAVVDTLKLVATYFKALDKIIQSVVKIGTYLIGALESVGQLIVRGRFGQALDAIGIAAQWVSGQIGTLFDRLLHPIDTDGMSVAMVAGIGDMAGVLDGATATMSDQLGAVADSAQSAGEAISDSMGTGLWDRIKSAWESASQWMQGFSVDAVYQNLRERGVNRLIEWKQLNPGNTPTPDAVVQKTLEYYKNQLAELQAKGQNDPWLEAAMKDEQGFIKDINTKLVLVGAIDASMDLGDAIQSNVVGAFQSAWNIVVNIKNAIDGAGKAIRDFGGTVPNPDRYGPPTPGEFKKERLDKVQNEMRDLAKSFGAPEIAARSFAAAMRQVFSVIFAIGDFFGWLTHQIGHQLVVFVSHLNALNMALLFLSAINLTRFAQFAPALAPFYIALPAIIAIATQLGALDFGLANFPILVNFVKQLDDGIQALSVTIGGLFSIATLLPFAKQIVSLIAKVVMPPINFIMWAVTTLGDLIRAAGGIIPFAIQAFNQGVTAIAGFYSSNLKPILDGFIGFFNAIYNIVKPILSPFIALLKWLYNLPFVKPIVDAIVAGIKIGLNWAKAQFIKFAIGLRDLLAPYVAPAIDYINVEIVPVAAAIFAEIGKGLIAAATSVQGIWASLIASPFVQFLIGAVSNTGAFFWAIGVGLVMAIKGAFAFGAGLIRGAITGITWIGTKLKELYQFGQWLLKGMQMLLAPLVKAGVDTVKATLQVAQNTYFTITDPRKRADFESASPFLKGLPEEYRKNALTGGDFLPFNQKIRENQIRKIALLDPRLAKLSIEDAAEFEAILGVINRGLADWTHLLVFPLRMITILYATLQSPPLGLLILVAQAEAFLGALIAIGVALGILYNKYPKTVTFLAELTGQLLLQSFALIIGLVKGIYLLGKAIVWLGDKFLWVGKYAISVPVAALGALFFTIDAVLSSVVFWLKIIRAEAHAIHQALGPTVMMLGEIFSALSEGDLRRAGVATKLLFLYFRDGIRDLVNAGGKALNDFYHNQILPFGDRVLKAIGGAMAEVGRSIASFFVGLIPWLRPLTKGMPEVTRRANEMSKSVGNFGDTFSRTIEQVKTGTLSATQVIGIAIGVLTAAYVAFGVAIYGGVSGSLTLIGIVGSLGFIFFSATGSVEQFADSMISNLERAIEFFRGGWKGMFQFAIASFDPDVIFQNLADSIGSLFDKMKPLLWVFLSLWAAFRLITKGGFKGGIVGMFSDLMNVLKGVLGLFGKLTFGLIKFGQKSRQSYSSLEGETGRMKTMRRLRTLPGIERIPGIGLSGDRRDRADAEIAKRDKLLKFRKMMEGHLDTIVRVQKSDVIWQAKAFKQRRAAEADYTQEYVAQVKKMVEFKKKKRFFGLVTDEQAVLSQYGEEYFEAQKDKLRRGQANLVWDLGDPEAMKENKYVSDYAAFRRADMTGIQPMGAEYGYSADTLRSLGFGLKNIRPYLENRLEKVVIQSDDAEVNINKALLAAGNLASGQIDTVKSTNQLVDTIARTVKVEAGDGNEAFVSEYRDLTSGFFKSVDELRNKNLPQDAYLAELSNLVQNLNGGLVKYLSGLNAISGVTESQKSERQRLSDDFSARMRGLSEDLERSMPQARPTQTSRFQREAEQREQDLRNSARPDRVVNPNKNFRQPLIPYSYGYQMFSYDEIMEAIKNLQEPDKDGKRSIPSNTLDQMNTYFKQAVTGSTDTARPGEGDSFRGKRASFMQLIGPTQKPGNAAKRLKNLAKAFGMDKDFDFSNLRGNSETDTPPYLKEVQILFAKILGKMGKLDSDITEGLLTHQQMKYPNLKPEELKQHMKNLGISQARIDDLYNRYEQASGGTAGTTAEKRARLTNLIGPIMDRQLEILAQSEFAGVQWNLPEMANSFLKEALEDDLMTNGRFDYERLDKEYNSIAGMMRSIRSRQQLFQVRDNDAFQADADRFNKSQEYFFLQRGLAYGVEQKTGEVVGYQRDDQKRFSMDPGSFSLPPIDRDAQTGKIKIYGTAADAVDQAASPTTASNGTQREDFTTLQRPLKSGGTETITFRTLEQVQRELQKVLADRDNWGDSPLMSQYAMNLRRAEAFLKPKPEGATQALMEERLKFFRDTYNAKLEEYMKAAGKTVDDNNKAGVTPDGQILERASAVSEQIGLSKAFADPINNPQFSSFRLGRYEDLSPDVLTKLTDYLGVTVLELRKGRKLEDVERIRVSRNRRRLIEKYGAMVAKQSGEPELANLKGIAKAAGMSPDEITQFLMGQPRKETIDAIARVLNLSAQDLSEQIAAQDLMLFRKPDAKEGKKNFKQFINELPQRLYPDLGFGKKDELQSLLGNLDRQIKAKEDLVQARIKAFNQSTEMLAKVRQSTRLGTDEFDKLVRELGLGITRKDIEGFYKTGKFATKEKETAFNRINEALREYLTSDKYTDFDLRSIEQFKKREMTRSERIKEFANTFAENSKRRLGALIGLGDLRQTVQTAQTKEDLSKLSPPQRQERMDKNRQQGIPKALRNLTKDQEVTLTYLVPRGDGSGGMEEKTGKINFRSLKIADGMVELKGTDLQKPIKVGLEEIRKIAIKEVGTVWSDSLEEMQKLAEQEGENVKKGFSLVQAAMTAPGVGPALVKVGNLWNEYRTQQEQSLQYLAKENGLTLTDLALEMELMGVSLEQFRALVRKELKKGADDTKQVLKNLKLSLSGSESIAKMSDDDFEKFVLSENFNVGAAKSLPGFLMEKTIKRLPQMLGRAAVGIAKAFGIGLWRFALRPFLKFFGKQLYLKFGKRVFIVLKKRIAGLFEGAGNFVLNNIYRWLPFRWVESIEKGLKGFAQKIRGFFNKRIQEVEEAKRIADQEANKGLGGMIRSLFSSLFGTIGGALKKFANRFSGTFLGKAGTQLGKAAKITAESTGKVVVGATKGLLRPDQTIAQGMKGRFKGMEQTGTPPAPELPPIPVTPPGIAGLLPPPGGMPKPYLLQPEAPIVSVPQQELSVLEDAPVLQVRPDVAQTLNTELNKRLNEAQSSLQALEKMYEDLQVVEIDPSEFGFRNLEPNAISDEMKRISDTILELIDYIDVIENDLRQIKPFLAPPGTSLLDPSFANQPPIVYDRAAGPRPGTQLLPYSDRPGGNVIQPDPQIFVPQLDGLRNQMLAEGDKLTSLMAQLQQAQARGQTNNILRLEDEIEAQTRLLNGIREQIDLEIQIQQLTDEQERERLRILQASKQQNRQLEAMIKAEEAAQNQLLPGVIEMGTHGPATPNATVPTPLQPQGFAENAMTGGLRAPGFDMRMAIPQPEPEPPKSIAQTVAGLGRAIAGVATTVGKKLRGAGETVKQAFDQTADVQKNLTIRQAVRGNVVQVDDRPIGSADQGWKVFKEGPYKPDPDLYEEVVQANVVKTVMKEVEGPYKVFIRNLGGGINNVFGLIGKNLVITANRARNTWQATGKTITEEAFGAVAKRAGITAFRTFVQWDRASRRVKSAWKMTGRQIQDQTWMGMVKRAAKTGALIVARLNHGAADVTAAAWERTDHTFQQVTDHMVSQAETAGAQISDAMAPPQVQHLTPELPHLGAQSGQPHGKHKVGLGEIVSGVSDAVQGVETVATTLAGVFGAEALLGGVVGFEALTAGMGGFAAIAGILPMLLNPAIAVVGLLGAAIAGLYLAFKNNWFGLHDKLQQQMPRFVAMWRVFRVELFQAAKAVAPFLKLLSALVTGGLKITIAVLKLGVAIVAQFAKSLSPGVWKGIFAVLTVGFTLLAYSMMPILGPLTGLVAGLWALWNIGSRIAKRLNINIDLAQATEAVNAFVDHATRAIEVLPQSWGKAIDWIQGKWQGFKTWFGGLMDGLPRFAVKAGIGLINALNHNPTEKIPQAWDKASGKIQGSIGEVTDAAKDAGKEASKSMSQLPIGGILGDALGVYNQVKDIKSAIQKQKDAAAEAAANATPDDGQISLFDVSEFEEPKAPDTFQTRLEKRLDAVKDFNGKVTKMTGRAKLGLNILKHFDLISPDQAKAVTFAISGVENLNKYITTAVTLIGLMNTHWQKFPGMVQKGLAFVKGLPMLFMNIGRAAAAAFMSPWVAIPLLIIGALTLIYFFVKKKFGIDLLQPILNGAKNLGVALVNALIGAVTRIQNAWSGMKNWFLTQFLSWMPKAFLNLGTLLIAALNHYPTVRIPIAWELAKEKILNTLNALLAPVRWVAQQLINILNHNPTEKIPNAWDDAVGRITNSLFSLPSIGDFVQGLLQDTFHVDKVFQNLSPEAIGKKVSEIKNGIAGLFGMGDKPVEAEVYGPQLPQQTTAPSPMDQIKEQAGSAFDRLNQWRKNHFGPKSEPEAATLPAAEQYGPQLPGAEIKQHQSADPVGKIAAEAASAVMNSAAAQGVMGWAQGLVQSAAEKNPMVANLVDRFDAMTFGQKPKVDEKAQVQAAPAAPAAPAPVVETKPAEEGKKQGFWGKAMRLAAGLLSEQKEGEQKSEKGWFGRLMSGIFGRKQQIEMPKEVLSDYSELLKAAKETAAYRLAPEPVKQAIDALPNEMSGQQYNILRNDPDMGAILQPGERRLNFDIALKESEEKAKQQVGEFFTTVRDEWNDRWDFLESTNGADLWLLFRPGFNEIKEGFSDMGNDIGDFAKRAGMAILHMNMSELVQAAKDFGGNFWDASKRVMDGFGGMTMSAIVFGIWSLISFSPVVTAIVAIGLAALGLATNFLGIRDMVVGLGKVVWNFIKLIGATLRFIKNVVESIKMIFHGLKLALTGDFSEIGTGWMMLYTSIQTYAYEMGNALMGIAEGGVQILQGAFKALWDTASGIFKLFGFSLKGLKDGFLGVVDVVGKLAGAIVDVMMHPEQILQRLLDFIESVKIKIDEIGLAIENSPIVRMMKGIGGRMKGKSGDQTRAQMDFDAELKQRDIDRRKEKLQQRTQGGDDDLDSLVPGLSDVVDGVDQATDKVESRWSRMVNFLRKPFKPNTDGMAALPEEVAAIAEQTEAVVTDMVTTVNGCELTVNTEQLEQLPQVVQSIESEWRAVSATIDPLSLKLNPDYAELEGLNERVSEIGDQIQQTWDGKSQLHPLNVDFGPLSGAQMEVTGIMMTMNEGLMQTIQTFNENQLPDVTETFKESIVGLPAVVQDMTEQVEGMFGAMSHGINNTVQGVADSMANTLSAVAEETAKVNESIKQKGLLATLGERAAEDTKKVGQGVRGLFGRKKGGDAVAENAQATAQIEQAWDHAATSVNNSINSTVETAVKAGEAQVSALNHNPTVRIPIAWEGASEEIQASIAALVEYSQAAGQGMNTALKPEEVLEHAAAVQEAAQDYIRSGGKLTDELSQVDSVVKHSLQAAAKQAEEGGKSLSDMGDQVSRVTNKFQGLADIISAVNPKLGSLVEGGLGMVESFAGAAEGIDAIGDGMKWVQRKGGIGGVLTKGKGKIMAALQPVVKAIQSAWGAILVVITGLISGTITFSVILAKITAGFALVAKAIGFVVGLLTWPVALALVAIIALVAAFKTNFLGIRDQFAGLWSSLKELGSALWQAFKPILDIVIFIGKIAAGIILAAIVIPLKVIVFIINVIVKAITLIIKGFALMGATFVKNLLTPFKIIGSIFKMLMNGVRAIGSAVVSALLNPFQLVRAAISSVLAIAGELFKFLSNPVGYTFGMIGKAVGFIGQPQDKTGGGEVQKFAKGGLITGPGTSTGDRVPILASRDEYIVNAAATRQNYDLLESINSGEELKVAPSPAAVLAPPREAYAPVAAPPSSGEVALPPMTFSFHIENINLNGATSGDMVEEFLDEIEPRMQRRMREMLRDLVDRMR